MFTMTWSEICLRELNQKFPNISKLSNYSYLSLSNSAFCDKIQYKKMYMNWHITLMLMILTEIVLYDSYVNFGNIKIIIVRILILIFTYIKLFFKRPYLSLICYLLHVYIAKRDVLSTTPEHSPVEHHFWNFIHCNSKRCALTTCNCVYYIDVLNSNIIRTTFNQEANNYLSW